jgi:hypothetical protein
MQVKKPYKNWIILITFSSIIFVSFYYWHQHRLRQTANTRLLKKNNFLAIDTLIKKSKHGNIIFRRGADGISDMFCNMNQKDKRYSHCGIILEDKKGILSVYHSIGGEDNPLAKIQKESIRSFVHPKNNLGFGIVSFPFLKPELNTLDSITKYWYDHEYTFDMDFKLDNDSTQLYCAEFVYKAINTAKKNKVYIGTSALKDFKYVAPDDILTNKNSKIVYQFSY